MPAVNVLHVKLSGGYRIDIRFDAFIDELLPVLKQQEPCHLTFDIEGLVAISPTCLALLTAVLKEATDRGIFWEGNGGNVKIVSRGGPVWNYLMRMDVFKLLLGAENYAEINEGFTRNKPVGFRPCQEFTTLDEFPPVSRSLVAALGEACEMDELALGSVRTCLDELSENVIHHADATHGGFAAAQGWRKSSTFEIGIVDLGIGIRSSLRKNAAYADIPNDATAITTALQPRVTSTPERNSGIGLFVTRLLLRENGGFFMVRSGNGAVYAGSEERTGEARTAFPGTIVALRARTDRPLNMKRVYGTLTRIEHELDARKHDDSSS